MMGASRVPPLDVLHRLWMDGVGKDAIALQFGVSVKTVDKWVTRYKLPRRSMQPRPEIAAPSEEDDAASLDSLALSPWVEERAKVCRLAHYTARRSETDSAAAKKARSWRIGEHQPRGASHAV